MEEYLFGNGTIGVYVIPNNIYLTTMVRTIHPKKKKIKKE